MHDTVLTGLALVVAAGLFQGSFLFPSKWMQGWAWENYWLIFAAVAYLVCPLALAVATVPHLSEVYAGVTARTLALTLLFGLAWGLGALSFGLGVDSVGLAIGFAVILGVAATCGAVIPFLLHPPEHFSMAQTVVAVGAIALMLAGVAVCSFAGKWKETQGTMNRSYSRGILICVLSGLLSSCGNLGFVFGAQVAHRAEGLGASRHLAGNAVWLLLAIPLFLCNSGYAVWLLMRNGTASCYRAAGSGRKILLGLSMGAMWMAGMSLYGMGARRMGDLGPSLGWAILMSVMVLVANLLGLAAGEWNGAPQLSKRRLAGGVMLLLVAIAGLGYVNQLQAGG